MRQLYRASAQNIMVFMVDSTDHLTGKTGLTLTITASKDGAAFASITPTVTERGNGWYNLALTATHTDTLGDLALHVTGTGADASDLIAQVLPGLLVSVNDASATTTSFVTTLTSTSDDIYTDSFWLFRDGANVGQVRRITAYNGTTKAVTCDAFSNAPANGDKGEIINN